MVKFIVKKDVRNFAIMMLEWFGIAVPATFVNSLIRFSFLQNLVSSSKAIHMFPLFSPDTWKVNWLWLSERSLSSTHTNYTSKTRPTTGTTRLTSCQSETPLSSCQRVSNLDSRIENADHCLTDDITAFTSSVAHLYSHISKPLLDTVLISAQLFRSYS